MVCGWLNAWLVPPARAPNPALARPRFCASAVDTAHASTTAAIPNDLIMMVSHANDAWSRAVVAPK
jgi:hypothetical protein